MPFITTCFFLLFLQLQISIDSARMPFAETTNTQVALNGALRTILAADLYYRTLNKYYIFYNILNSDSAKSGKY